MRLGDFWIFEAHEEPRFVLTIKYYNRWFVLAIKYYNRYDSVEYATEILSREDAKQLYYYLKTCFEKDGA